MAPPYPPALLEVHPSDISPGDVAAFDLIDVRTHAEFREVHAAGASCVPLDRLDPAAVDAARKHRERPLHLLCRSGARARMAASSFRDAGIHDIVVIAGGTDAWVQAGHPVVRGKKAVSLERQVRIAAGALVVVGVVVGWFVHPAGFGLSAFVGAGLVVAGITDTCMMGMLIARMPWNRGSDQATVHCPAHAGDRPTP
ncbi:MAG: rhodanese-like domain-containing protein [Planctomycetes bacterium]|nr:rhodanese-like domain-containing protein [Planctomycetota bacterium]